MAAIVSTADELFRELSEPSDMSVSSIAFWITSNIGQLNNLLDLEYAVVDEELVPALGDNEKAVLKTLLEIWYYKKQINKNLGAAAYTTISEVREGNRTVRRANKNEVAKTYVAMLKELKDTLSEQVLAYKMNSAEPQQVLVPRPILTDLPISAYSSINTRNARSAAVLNGGELA